MPQIVNVQNLLELQVVKQVRTIPEALRETPGVMVQRTGHGQGSPYIRGFTGLRTLFLIDGIRLNNSTFREGPNPYWNTVDPWSVARLELVKGPSSVLYGSDAIGGTVNAISREFGDAAAPGNRYSRIAVRVASAESSAVVRPEFGYSNDKLALHAGLSFKRFGDLRAGNGSGRQDKTGYGEANADIKLNWKLAAGRELVVALQHTDQDDAWRTHKTVFGQSWHGTTTGDELQRSFDQRRTLVYLQYRAQDLSPNSNRLILSLSWHQQDETRLRVQNDGRSDEQGTRVGTLGIWGQLEIPAHRSTWVLGAEYYRDQVDSFRTDWNSDGTQRAIAIQGPVADDASYVTGAVFVQNQLTLGERATVITGLRYTRSVADANAVRNPVNGERMSITGDWDELVGSVRLSHRVGSADQVVMFVGISQGFRAPNLSDLTRFDSARSNEFEIPVAELDAERFVTAEVGLKFDSGRWTGQFAVFDTRIDDMIVRTPTGQVVDGEVEITKTNSGRGFVRGVELQARYRPTESWELFGNAAWIDGAVDGYPTATSGLVREPLDRLMPFRAFLGARWQQPAARLWIEGLLSMSGSQDRLSTRDRLDTDRIPAGGTPGFAAVTLRGGWQQSDTLGISVALENLFDQDYRIHGSGLNEAGRNIVVSVFWAPLSIAGDSSP